MSVVTCLATVLAWSEAEMRTPGMVSPASRITVPLIDPPVACARALPANAKVSTKQKSTTIIGVMSEVERLFITGGFVPNARNYKSLSSSLRLLEELNYKKRKMQHACHA